MVTKRIYLGDMEETLLLCGEHDSNLRTLEKKLGVQIFARSSNLAIRGNARKVDEAIASLEELREKINVNRRNGNTAKGSIWNEESAGMKGGKAPFPSPEEGSIFVSALGKKIRPLTEHQKAYVESIGRSDLVMAVGPAGTGKTFLAVACALRDLNLNRVGRIVLTRPVVEAGEKLGFLPGDFYEKINPYLRPLYDAFHTLLGPERFRAYKEEETIEIVPLAYMRGRTLENAFVILDEAQNTTPEQMKMFLTRMGLRSKVVVTGDVTQIDLDFKKRSGFVQSLKILKNIPELEIVHLTDEDVVRHSLVRKILHAYDTQEDKEI